MASQTSKHVLYVNGLNLPSEIINIIKEFAFDEITSKSKKNKKRILLVLNTSIYTVVPLMFNSIIDPVGCVSSLKFAKSNVYNGKKTCFNNVYCFKCGEKFILCSCSKNDLLLLEYSRNNISELISDNKAKVTSLQKLVNTILNILIIFTSCYFIFVIVTFIV
jgi:uncharacterized protein YeeX (DUF496 family)